MWVCMYRVVNVRPAVLFCICLSLTLVHPTGRGTSCFCQQGRLRSALLPLLWGWNKGEGYPKTEEEKERIDKAISWFGKGIKGIQLNWACTERRKSNMGSSSILVPSTVIQAFHYQPWEDFVSHKLLSAPVFFSKQCQCSTFYILFTSKHFVFRIMLPYKVLFGRSWALLLKCSWWYCSSM